jgi:hypothetical protein
MPPSRVTLAFIRNATLLLSILAGGCAHLAKMAQPKPAPAANGEVGNRAAEVQHALMVFVDRFMPALAEACDYIEKNSEDPEARAAAKARKVGGALAAMKNAVNPNPYAGLLDMVVMVTLLSDVADTPASKATFGPYGQRFSAMMKDQRTEIWASAEHFVTSAQLQELQQSIDQWREAHSTLQYVSFIRMSDFPETKQMKKGRSSRPNSVFGLLFLDPLSNLDPAVREFEMSRQLAERAFFYVQRMPLIVAWQTDQMYTAMLAAPEVQDTMASVHTAAGSTTRFTQAAVDFTAVSQRFQRDLPQLRSDTVRELEQAMDRQRDAVIRQATTMISVERDAAIRQAAASLATERGATVEQVASALRTEQREVAQSLDGVLHRSIDQMYWRALMIVIALLLVFSTCIVLFRLLPSRTEAEPSARSHLP